MTHQLTLDGLRLEPLASYLAALGVLRLVAEQADPEAQGWWQNERFHLQSKLDATELVRFFLQDYCPTPMANPWNTDGGFFGRSSYSGITRIEQSDSPRFADYRAALTVIRDTLKAHNLEQKPKTPAIKLELLRSLHSDFTPSARRYLDTVLTLDDNDFTYHALFFSGGNSGSIDLARSFMHRLGRLLLPTAQQRRPGSRESESLLQAALFDTLTCQLDSFTGGPYDPGTSAGVNATSTGFDVDASCNPWAYVLGMEGTLLLRGGRGETAHSSVGYPSAIAEETNMPDLRLPVWSEPQTRLRPASRFGATSGQARWPGSDVGSRLPRTHQWTTALGSELALRHGSILTERELLNYHKLVFDAADLLFRIAQCTGPIEDARPSATPSLRCVAFVWSSVDIGPSC